MPNQGLLQSAYAECLCDVRVRAPYSFLGPVWNVDAAKHRLAVFHGVGACSIARPQSQRPADSLLAQIPPL